MRTVRIIAIVSCLVAAVPAALAGFDDDFTGAVLRVDYRHTGTATEEAREFGWFTEHELPWDELAFPRIEPQVRQVYRWLKSGEYGIRIGFIDEKGSQYRVYRLSIEN